MNIQKQRELLQELIVSGKLDSLSVQAIALNIFANSIGYEAVNGDIRKGFVGYDHKTWNVTHNISLEEMQYRYNHITNHKQGEWFTYEDLQNMKQKRIVSRISIQYNKKLGKLKTQLYWLKFLNSSSHKEFIDILK